MAEQKTTEQTTRAQRGINLYREYRDQIDRVGPAVYTVPSCSGDHAYTVYLRPVVICTCLDSKRAKGLGAVCKHAHAAQIAHSKRARTASA